MVILKRIFHWFNVVQESLLQNLQSSVEGEEIKWLSVVKEKEDKIEQITKDNVKLREDLQSANSSSPSLQKVSPIFSGSFWRHL